MEAFFYVGGFIVIAIIFGNLSNRNKQQRGRGRGLGRAFPQELPPDALGLPLGHPARSAAQRLESAIEEGFESRVHDRVLQAQPKMTVAEWQWTCFELKRFFLLCALLRNVPMY